jgi:transposase
VMARLRDLTRYAKKLTEERTREIQRLQRVLEDAGIKLDSVASDVMGKSARAMLEALIAGERDPAVLADFAQTRMRVKIPELRLALEGGFSEHHALLLRMLLDHIDHLTAAVDRLDAQVEAEIAPFSQAVELLGTIPGLARARPG